MPLHEEMLGFLSDALSQQHVIQLIIGGGHITSFMMLTFGG